MKNILAVLVLIMLGIIVVGYGYNRYQNKVMRVEYTSKLIGDATPKCYNIKRNGERVVVPCESTGITSQNYL